MRCLLLVQDVLDLHDDVLNPKELPGLAGDKSLEGVLGRVDFRISYGQIQDEFDLAAAYAVAISQGHVFNDGNKRSAFAAMDMALVLNGIVFRWQEKEVGDVIIKTAQGQLDETELATWLRNKKLSEK